MSREPIGDINLEMLKEFSEAHGISGNEKEVSRVMKKWIEPYADEITYDNLGSLVALQKGDKDGVKVIIAYVHLHQLFHMDVRQPACALP